MNYLLLLIAIPFLGAVSTLLLGKYRSLQSVVLIGSSISLFCLVLQIVLCDCVDISTIQYQLLSEINLSLGLKLEYIGMIFCLLSSGLWAITSFYTVGYMRKHYPKRDLSVFFASLSLSIACVMGIAVSRDLLTLFIFYELLTLSTYPLVVFEGSSESIIAARSYIRILMGTSLTLFFAFVVWVLSKSSDLSFVNGGFLQGKLTSFEELLLPVLFVFGIAKSAIMPIHRWLPKAMVAPVPVSSLLHAVAVVKAGIFTLTKIIVYVFGVDYFASIMNINWLMYLSGITIILSSFFAIYQDSIKSVLAYSTISQLSYMIMTLSLGTDQAVMAAIMHMIFHGVSKITLFFAVGSIYVTTGKQKISQLEGEAYSMPYTSSALFIGVIAMIGLPPTAIFWSKCMILQEAFTLNNYFPIAVLVASTIMNVMYFVPMLFKIFKRNEICYKYNDAGMMMVVPLLVTALTSIIMFFLPILDFVLLLRNKLGA